MVVVVVVGGGGGGPRHNCISLGRININMNFNIMMNVKCGR